MYEYIYIYIGIHTFYKKTKISNPNKNLKSGQKGKIMIMKFKD